MFSRRPSEGQTYLSQPGLSAKVLPSVTCNKATMRRNNADNASHTLPLVTSDDDDNDEIDYNSKDELYGDQLDDQDEAWVDQHLRLKDQQQKDGTTTDAILSCTCCFTVVCMDCQRHERYATQFRAMFVMNIHVDWTLTLVYQDETQQLVKQNENDNDTKELYYSVHCQNCNTQVAALDRVEEIYHFFACLASN